MEMDGKNIKKLIDEQTDKLEVPASLQPEAVVERLEEKAKKKRRSYYKKAAAFAACGVVVLGIGAVGMRDRFSPDNGEMLYKTADKGEKIESGAVTAGRIDTAEDFDQIYGFIKAERDAQEKDAAAYGAEKNAVSDIASSAQTMQADSTAGVGYSDTNIRQDGVGEGDIAKTDGERLYILNNQTIEIVGIGQETMEKIGEIPLNGEVHFSEFFVEGDRLVAVYGEYPEETGPTGSYPYREYTTAETFDISDPENPVSLGKITQSGSYHTMRIVDGYVYLFSDFRADISVLRTDLSGYIPTIQGEYMDSSNIVIPPVKRGSSYTVITSFSLQDPGEETDSKAVFGTAGLCYVSGKNIYICETEYASKETETDATWIRKLSYENGELKAVAQAKVQGVLNDSFSIDEYEGNLRLVTTVTPGFGNSVMPISQEEDSVQTTEKTVTTNTLYVLDDKLKELSRIEELAPDESIYSARFIGNTGYFVTFRQIDPLFSVDLSDPKKPEILGALKIPGFSEYLHPYGDGLLLGIGMDTDPTGMTTNGVKLSMFDVSDPKDVREIQKYVIEGAYSTDAAYNYKVVLADPEKNLIGFTVNAETISYYVFSYGEDGFTCLMQRDMTGYATNVRAFYVGDRFYLIAGNTVEAYDVHTFEKLDDIVL